MTAKRKALKDLISKGKIKAALEQLIILTQHNADLHNEVIHLKARWTEHQRQKRLHTTDNNDLNREAARIQITLLEIIDHISEEVTAHPRLMPWQMGVILVTLVGVLAGVAEISGFSIRDFFRNESATITPPAIDSTTLKKIEPEAEVEEKTSINIKNGDNNVINTGNSSTIHNK
ncbi:MAG: hypothetical protein ACK4TA_25540 [Saprospiraceae bacterium]